MLSASIKTQSSISALKKAGFFSVNVETFINERIPEIVSCNISSLSSSVVKAMMDPILPVVNTEILKWQQHDYVTLDDFEQGLNSKNDETLSLTYHRDVLSVGISDFVDSSILETVLNEFVLICEKSGVIGKQDFSNLISTAKKYWASFEKDEHPQCLLEKLDIKDCIQHFSKSISAELSKKFFFVLTNIPALGFVLLVQIAACNHGGDACVAKFFDNVKKYDLPQWLRERILVDQVDNITSEQKNNIHIEIDSLICNDEDFLTHISRQICTALQNFINGVQAVLISKSET